MTDSRYPQLKSRSWLHSQYVVRGLTSEQIAINLGCSRQAVDQALHRRGIGVRGRRGKPLPTSEPTTITITIKITVEPCDTVTVSQNGEPS